MKKTAFSLFHFFTLSLLVACTTNSYETGEGPNSYLNSSFGEIQTNSEARVSALLLDNGSTVALTEQTAISGVKADTIYRGLIYYTQEGGSTTLANFTNVTVCYLASKAKVKEIVQDPIDIESTWISADGKYLNLTLLTKIGNVTDGGKMLLGLVLEHKTTMTDGSTHYYISLYHSQSTVPEYYTDKTYISVPCQDYFNKGDSITIDWTAKNGSPVQKSLLFH